MYATQLSCCCQMSRQKEWKRAPYRLNFNFARESDPQNHIWEQDVKWRICSPKYHQLLCQISWLCCKTYSTEVYWNHLPAHFSLDIFGQQCLKLIFTCCMSLVLGLTTLVPFIIYMNIIDPGICAGESTLLPADHSLTSVRCPPQNFEHSQTDKKNLIDHRLCMQFTSVSSVPLFFFFKSSQNSQFSHEPIRPQSH